MTRTWFPVVAAFAFGAILAGFGLQGRALIADSPSGKSPSGNSPSGKTAATPADQIKQLQERIASLEARIATLEQNSPVPSTNWSLPVVPGGQTNTLMIPDDWTPGEINGMTFYTIPINDQNSPPLRAAASPRAGALPRAGVPNTSAIIVR